MTEKTLKTLDNKLNVSIIAVHCSCRAIRAIGVEWMQNTTSIGETLASKRMNNSNVSNGSNTEPRRKRSHNNQSNHGKGSFNNHSNGSKVKKTGLRIL